MTCWVFTIELIFRVLGVSYNNIFICPVKFPPLIQFLQDLIIKVTAIAYVPISWIQKTWICTGSMIVVFFCEIWMIEWCLTDTRGWIFMKLSTAQSHFLRFTHESALAWFHLSRECVPVHLISSLEQSTESFGIWSDGPLVPHVPPMVWPRKQLAQLWKKEDRNRNRNYL